MDKLIKDKERKTPVMWMIPKIKVSKHQEKVEVNIFLQNKNNLTISLYIIPGLRVQPQV